MATEEWRATISRCDSRRGARSGRRHGHQQLYERGILYSTTTKSSPVATRGRAPRARRLSPRGADVGETNTFGANAVVSLARDSTTRCARSPGRGEARQGRRRRQGVVAGASARPASFRRRDDELARVRAAFRAQAEALAEGASISWWSRRCASRTRSCWPWSGARKRSEPRFLSSPRSRSIPICCWPTARHPRHGRKC